MSLIAMLCEEPCPAHPTVRCLREAGHPMPHKGALRRTKACPTDLDPAPPSFAIAARMPAWIGIEWRPIEHEADHLASLD